jgi:probable HAF family extracellular repeat protein
MKPLTLFIAVLFIAVLASAGKASAQSLVCLGDLGGGSSYASGINDNGQVAGYSIASDGATYAFLYANGKMTNLGALGGTGSKATGINNSGEVVGYFFTSTGATNGFLYADGTMGNIGTLSSSENYCVAAAINVSGEMAGWSMPATGTVNAVATPRGSLSSLGANSYAFGINKLGEIVGISQVTGGNPTAFLYASGTTVNLGTLGGSSSYANAINDSGQVVGNSSTSNGSVCAFLYSGNSMTNLGTLPDDLGSQANAINNAGTVVGVSNGTQSRAFVYSPQTGMLSLNTLYQGLLVSGQTSQPGFMSLTTAQAINNSGQIVGTGTYWNGTTQLTEAFLLTPGVASSDTPTMPQWGLIALALLLVGVAGRFLPAERVAR